MSSSVLVTVSPPITCRVPATSVLIAPPTIGARPSAFSGALAIPDAASLNLARATILMPSIPLSTVSKALPITGIPEKILINPSSYIDATVRDIIPPPDKTTAILCTNARICHIKKVTSMRPNTSDHITIQPCLMFLIML